MERHFLEELKKLKERLFQMGLYVENAIDKAVTSLLESDTKLSDEVFADENVINQLEIEIDEAGHSLFALVQPVAVDLRMLTMILKINVDLERMGDHAVNIAQRCLESTHTKVPQGEVLIRCMATALRKIIRDALDCFMNENVELARRVLKYDDEIDGYNDKLYHAMVDVAEHQTTLVACAINLVRVGHDLERIADLANNIAEDTIYFKEGKEVRHHYETT